MSVWHFVLIAQAFDAIREGKKIAEIRLERERNIQRGDYICFEEWEGIRQQIVVVDEVRKYEGIEDLLENVPQKNINFEPLDEFNKLIQSEFYVKENVNSPAIAIFFHLPKVSIVMPVYNAAPFLPITLECLEKQTYNDFEFIIVDDCSDDNSAEIIRSNCERLPIRLIPNNEHKGAAEARNIGLRNAAGEYITFLDADDLFEPILLEQWVNALETHEADVAIADYDSFAFGEYTKSGVPALIDAFSMRGAGEIFHWRDIPAFFSHWTNVPWNKMIRRRFLINTGIEFQNLESSNDVYFSHMVMIRGNLIHTSSHKALIHYRIGRKDQISSSRNPFCEIEAYKKIIVKLKEDGLYEIYGERILDDFIYGLCMNLRDSIVDKQEEFYCAFREEVLSTHQFFKKEYLERKHSLLVKKMKEQHFADRWFDTNFKFEELLWNNKAQLSNLMEYIEEYENVVVFRAGKLAKYILEAAEGKKIKLCVDRECQFQYGGVLLVLSPLHLTDLQQWMEEKQLENTQIIAVYKLMEG